MYIVKKEKYRDCEELSLKYITIDNNFLFKIKRMLLIAINMLCQVFIFGLTRFSIPKMQNSRVYY